MKVRMKEQITGFRNGVRWPAPGETLDVLEAEAVDLIAGGLAEVVAQTAAKSAEKRPGKKASESRKK